MDARLQETERTRHRRLRAKGSTARSDLDAVLAAGFVCHLGFARDGQVVVLPTVYGYDGERLFLHGSVASRSMVASPEQEICVTVTHVDGLTLARSVFEHGVNYRSAMVFGAPRTVTDESELLHGLRTVSEQAAPGQWDYARRPSRKELAATTLLALEVDEASVKISADHPDDGEGPDAELSVWAGRLPLRHSWGTPEPDPLLKDGIPLPAHIAARAGTVADRPGAIHH